MITIRSCFFLSENADAFHFESYDYVIDAVDAVTAKNELVLPLISNKLNPAMLEVAGIYQTSVYLLARVMRRELKKRGVKKLKVISSREEPIKPAETDIGQRALP